MVEYFAIENDGGFHRADFDVSMCAELAPILIKKYQETENKNLWSNPDLKPTITSIKAWKKHPKAWQNGNYLFVNTDMGNFRYDRYTFDWTVVERKKPVSIEAVSKAAFEYAGVNNDIDFSSGKWM